MKHVNEETDQLKALLSSVYEKGNAGATLKEIMVVLKKELPKITKQSEYPIK